MRRDLVEAARRGDHEAFEVLATSAGDRLYAVARLILRDRTWQRTRCRKRSFARGNSFLRCVIRIRFDAWLYRLVVNACADQGRQLRRWSNQVRPLPSIPRSATTPGRSPTGSFSNGGSHGSSPSSGQSSSSISTAASRRPIARMLGIPEGTARSRLHYATEAMRAALQADARQHVVAQNGTV